MFLTNRGLNKGKNNLQQNKNLPLLLPDKSDSAFLLRWFYFSFGREQLLL
jgi:hypothetical protein